MLSADFKILGEELKATEDNGATYIHYDVMDGMFVPSLSFGPGILQSIRPASNMVHDVHLMIEEPIRYIEAFAKASADIITVHIEACKDLDATIAKIKECGCKVGVSVKPATPVSALKPYLDKIDMILIMSVEPGFGGQKFIPTSLAKIEEARAMVNESGLNIDIQVDGGIYTHNVEDVLKAGANIIVAGSAVYNGDTVANTKAMMEILKKYE
jgi:ribulose-phosphate 3-epimerase